MSPSAFDALRALRFDYSPVAEDIWRPLQGHVDGVQPAAEAALLAALNDAEHSDGPSPLGLVLSGKKGSGKTHLLRWLRQNVEARRGYFFLVELLDARHFWDSVVLALTDGLRRPWGGELTQAQVFLFVLGTKIGASEDLLLALTGGKPLTPEALDEFETLLANRHPMLSPAVRATGRAVILGASPDLRHQETAELYFQSITDPYNERQRWRLPRTAPLPEELVGHLTMLLALDGPIVMAVDQLDTLVTQSTRSLGADDTDRSTQYLLLERIGGGLMALRQHTRRTLTVVACLPPTWVAIKEFAPDSVADRFRQTEALRSIESPDVARELVAQRFAPHYRRVGFVPPTPTWPVVDDAFESAVGRTPRRLLEEIDRRLRSTEVTGQLELVDSFGPDDAAASEPEPDPPSAEVFQQLDYVFSELKAASNPALLRGSDNEDTVWPAALDAALWAWRSERGTRRDEWEVDLMAGTQSALHARLRHTPDDGSERSILWSFRMISARHQGTTALAKLTKAVTAAALSDDVDGRHLVLLRDGPWSTGVETRQTLATARDRGAVEVEPTDDDLRSLLALQALRGADLDHLEAWLLDRQVASQLQLLRHLNLGNDGDDTAVAVDAGRAGE
jgi:hypothetical protein